MTRYQADSTAVLLSTPCWWIDRGDCWEITHHATREDADAGHADRVRDEFGWILSVTGAFALVPGVARQESYRCYAMTCPVCGRRQHHHGTRFVECVDECGHEFEIEQVAPDIPGQTRLFTVRRSDVDGLIEDEG